MKILLPLTLLTVVMMMASCGSDDDEIKSLDMNFKLQYDGDPLVMFEDVTYPNDETMEVTRVSFYLSDIALRTTEGETEIVSEAEYVDLTDSHIDAEKAVNGYMLNLDTDGGNYDQLSFNIGLTESQNASVPEDYTSDNALSKSAEYWRSWNSYVFIKIEGYMDYNKNDVMDSGEAFGLHLGTDASMRSMTSGISDPGEVMDIVIDIKDVFENENGIYDIAAGPRLHTLSDATLANMAFLADGFELATSVK